LKKKTVALFHTIFGQKLQSKLKEEIDDLFSFLNLKEKLDFLDKIDLEQAELSQGETVW
jgi:hypothetical protein